jgi:hypothetical protein
MGDVRREGVRIQIKDITTGKSRSMTVYNSDVDEVYNRVFFLFEQLQLSDCSVVIEHKKVEQ